MKETPNACLYEKTINGNNYCKLTWMLCSEVDECPEETECKKEVDDGRHNDV